MSRAERRAARRPRQHELVECLCDLVAAELEDVLLVLEEPVLREESAELAHLVPEPREEPVVAEELVLLDVGEHGAREREQLLEGLARLVVEQPPVLLGEPVSLARELLGRTLDLLAVPEGPHVADDRRVRDARIVVPAAVEVVETVPGRHVEPGVLDALELLEPRAPRVAPGQLGVDLGRSAPLDEGAVDARVDRQLRHPAQLRARLEEQHVDARDHLRDVLVGDVRELALAELGERHVCAVAEEQELEVVLPHQVAAAKRPVVRGEHLVERRVPVVLEGHLVAPRTPGGRARGAP